MYKNYIFISFTSLLPQYFKSLTDFKIHSFLDIAYSSSDSCLVMDNGSVKQQNPRAQKSVAVQVFQ